MVAGEAILASMDGGLFKILAAKRLHKVIGKHSHHDGVTLT